MLTYRSSGDLAYDAVDNLSEFTECVSEMSVTTQNSYEEAVFMLRDFNAHPGTLFGMELFDFCYEHQWKYSDHKLRFITFFLACCLCYAVSVGLAVALIAGIAYGYNYSLAEFLTFSKSDVTVYMRRGQFYDRPDVVRGFRRSGGGDTDQLGGSQLSNTGIDYSELRRKSVDTKPADLIDTLQKAQDTRTYAEKLVKYEHKPYQRAMEMSDEAVQAQGFTEPTATLPQMELTEPRVYYKLTSPPGITPSHWTTMLISITPNLALSTAVFHSGTSQIVMRNFKPVEVIEVTRTTPPAFEEYPLSTEEDKLGNMDLVESPDNFKPSYFKNIDAALPRTQFVKRVKPPQVPPMKYSDYQEYQESTSRQVETKTRKRWRAGTPSRARDYPTEDFYET